jgi:hypothetical protein
MRVSDEWTTATREALPLGWCFGLGFHLRLAPFSDGLHNPHEHADDHEHDDDHREQDPDREPWTVVQVVTGEHCRDSEAAGYRDEQRYTAWDQQRRLPRFTAEVLDVPVEHAIHVLLDGVALRAVPDEVQDLELSLQPFATSTGNVIVLQGPEHVAAKEPDHAGDEGTGPGIVHSGAVWRVRPLAGHACRADSPGRLVSTDRPRASRSWLPRKNPAPLVQPAGKLAADLSLIADRTRCHAKGSES